MTKHTTRSTTSGNTIPSLDGIRAVAILPGFFALSLVAAS